MRPEIICHMISSIDGRLQIERYSKLYNTENQDLALKTYLELGENLNTDAWMIGRGTVQSMGLIETFISETDLEPKELVSFVAEKSSKNYCVIFDSKGRIKFPSDTFEKDNIIVILGESTTEDYLVFLRGMGISYLFAGKDGNDLNLAMESLYSDFGIKRIQLNGGGVLNGAFLNAGLIDEVSIMLYPGIDGLSGISSIFEYKGDENSVPAQGQSLILKDIQTLDAGLVWIQYDVHRDKTMDYI